MPVDGYIEGTKPPRLDNEGLEARGKKRGDDITATLKELEDDYNACYRIIRKTYGYLEKIGLRDFNKFSKYKWSFDRDARGYTYVCVRQGGSLLKKSLVKRSGEMEEADLLHWLDNKDLVCEAIDEAYEYIDNRLAAVSAKIEDMRVRLSVYEDHAASTEDAMDAQKVF